MITVLVTGGRDYDDARAVSRALTAAWYSCDGMRVIHGAARGADTLADEWCTANNVSVTQYPADWKQHGKAAGMIRNVEMLERGKPDLVIAFPGGRGTAGCVREARKRGIEVVQVGEQ